MITVEVKKETKDKNNSYHYPIIKNKGDMILLFLGPHQGIILQNIPPMEFFYGVGFKSCKEEEFQIFDGSVTLKNKILE